MNKVNLTSMCRWLCKDGIHIDEEGIIRTAYFEKYGVYDLRYRLLMDRFNKKGIVPEFVADFLRNKILIRNG